MSAVCVTHDDHRRTDERPEPPQTIRGAVGGLVATIAWSDCRQGDWVPFDEWISSAPAGPLPVRRCEDAFQVYTSGTTGRPKGALGTHGALFALLYQWRDAVPLTCEDRFLIVAPMYPSPACCTRFTRSRAVRQCSS